MSDTEPTDDGLERPAQTLTEWPELYAGLHERVRAAIATARERAPAKPDRIDELEIAVRVPDMIRLLDRVALAERLPFEMLAFLDDHVREIKTHAKSGAGVVILRDESRIESASKTEALQLAFRSWLREQRQRAAIAPDADDAGADR